LGLLLFMGVLLVSTFVLLEEQQERALRMATENAQDDLQFMKHMLSDSLQQNNFEHLDGLVKSWGRHVRDTQELKLTAANGFVLGHFQRQGPATHPYRLEATIPYSYQGEAKLLFIKDLGNIDANIAKLRWKLLAGLALIGLVLWRIAWLSFYRKEKALALDQANRQLRETAMQLETTRAYLRNVFDSMPSILMGVDTQGRVTIWNKRAEDVYGLSAETVRGRPCVEVLPDAAACLPDLRAAIDSGEPVRFERHLTHVDGIPHYSEVVIYPLSSELELGAVIRIEDITQRVQMEQLMLQSEKMLTVGGLAAGMAHEINNPLSGVLQSSQNILRRISPELPANRAIADELGLDLDAMGRFLERRGILGFLEGIREAAGRASRIVADMLAFIRRSTAEFSPVSINEILDTVVRISANDYDLKKTYDFKKIEIVREYDPGLSPVSCDRTEIEQVLLNLIKNAAHAMAEQERHGAQRILLRTTDEGEWARIEIEDNGPGMEEAVRNRVFEPFFTTKPIGMGTGLGLSVSYYIITKQHNGTISVESEPGMGTRFIIRLPYVSSPQAQPPAECKSGH